MADYARYGCFVRHCANRVVWPRRWSDRRGGDWDRGRCAECRRSGGLQACARGCARFVPFSLRADCLGDLRGWILEELAGTRFLPLPRFATVAGTALRSCNLIWKKRRSASAPLARGFGGTAFALDHERRLTGSQSKADCSKKTWPARSAGLDEARRQASEVWRRGWDSNPRALADKTLSRRPRYDHFGTSPFFTAGGYGGDSDFRSASRRSLKNAWMISRHSPSSTPPVASIRWFNDGCSWARMADSIAPALSSRVP